MLTHPTLDWLNNYGLRWLMPFDGTWFYGDALFIIDPWVWLTLGGVLFLRHSNRRLARFGDTRYLGPGRLNGPTVRLDRNLSISEAPP